MGLLEGYLMGASPAYRNRKAAESQAAARQRDNDALEGLLGAVGMGAQNLAPDAFNMEEAQVMQQMGQGDGVYAPEQQGSGLLGGKLDPNELAIRLMQMQSRDNRATGSSMLLDQQKYRDPQEQQGHGLTNITRGNMGNAFGINSLGQQVQLEGAAVPQTPQSPLVQIMNGAQKRVEPVTAAVNDPYGFSEGTKYYFDKNGKPTEITQKGRTESQGKANTFALRQEGAAKELDTLESEGYDPTDISNTFKNIALKYGGAVAKGMVSEQQQRYNQAMLNWGMANLRDETGAVLGAEELEDQLQLYFPQPGQPPSVVAQKKRSREAAEKGMRMKAGLPPKPAAKKTETDEERYQRLLATGRYND